MDEIEVQHLIPLYPDKNDEKLIVNLSLLEEFANLQLEPREDKPTIPGQAMQHQELQSRYFSINTPYRKGLIYHEVGTGKTFTSSLIVERFKISQVDGQPRRPALILVRNKALREAFINEISTVATNNVYSSKLTKAQLANLSKDVLDITLKEIHKKVASAVAKTYEIQTYGKLLNVNHFPGDDSIVQNYSDRVIIIDEVQNLREQVGKTNKKRKTQYKNLHHLLHLVKNSTILLLTGTPIWDKVYDIAGIFNLILPLDDQLPVLNNFIKKYFDKDGTLIKKDKLANKLRGLVSYVRPLTSTTQKEIIGVSHPWLKHVKVYPSAMSDFQREITASLSDNVVDDTDLLNILQTTKDSLYTKERDAINCIYPKFDDNGVVIDGVYGKDAFKNAMIKTAKDTLKYSFNRYELYKRELGPAKGANPYINLQKYSTKFATIIKGLRDPANSSKKFLIYLNSVKGTGGAISFALILRLWGFSWIKRAKNAHAVNISAETPGNFTVITSDDKTTSDSKDITDMIDKWNKPSNKYGNKLRVIVGSEAISTGYTLKDTRDVHIVRGAWNLSEIEQALGRVDRIGSFDQLPENERQLNIYQHVAVDSYELDEKDPDDLKMEGKKNGWVKIDKKLSGDAYQTHKKYNVFSTNDTIDTYIYKVAEKKEYLKSQIDRLLKEVSWDCALTYKRNVLDIDINGSRECDYTTCNYQCNNYPSSDIIKTSKVWEYPLENTIATNYNILYASKRIQEYGEMIVTLFKSYFVLKLENIILLLNASNEQFIVLKALQKIINLRIIIRNSYGFKSYLNEQNDTYYLSDITLTGESNYMSYIYSMAPLVTENSTLENSVEVMQLDADKKFVKRFLKDPTSENFNKLSYRTQIVFFENVIVAKNLDIQRIKKLSKKERLVMEVINTEFNQDLFQMSDGKFVHNLYNLEYVGVGYNVKAQALEPNGKLRVFDPKINEWDYVPEHDENVYINEIKDLSEIRPAEKAGIPEAQNPYKIYGSYDKSHNFKIIDDRGKTRSGIVCTTVNGTKIYELIKYLNHLPFNDEISSKATNKSSKELRKLIAQDKNYKKSDYNIKNMDKKELQKVYTLFLMNKRQVCGSLERFMKGENPLKVSLMI